MFKSKTKSLILLSIFSISISSNLFAKKDPTLLTETTKEFYSQKKWDYLEKILMKDLHFANSRTENIKNYVARAALFAPITIAGLALYSCCKFDECKTVIFPARVSPEDIVAAMIPETVKISFYGVINYIATNGFWSYFFKTRIRKEKLSTMFELFFKNYNPKIDIDSDEINNKEIIPVELRKTFDLMYLEYELNGKKALMKICLDISDYIIEEIKYKVKEKKYKSLRDEDNRFSKRYNETVKNLINLGRK